MGYVLGSTPGKNKYIAGTSTFSDVWPEGSEAVALERDKLDREMKWLKGSLTDTDSADAIAETGTFQVHSAVTATALGLPFAAMGFLLSEYGNASYGRQEWRPLGTSDLFERLKNSGVWGPWKKIGGGQTTTATAYGLANAVLLQDYTRRRGSVSTGGKGAVALRFDHGLGNFRDIILPLLRARGLPSSLALNSRSWGLAENGGVAAADVNTWVQNDRVEVWNHGAHHGDADSTAALEDTIVAGLSELRSQIPAAVIDGFAVPGVGGTNYAGFNGGATLQSFYGTEAGRLILSHHAVTSGYLPSTTHRVLDGVVRQGQNHYTIDAATGTAAEYQIDQAIANRTGLQIMLHPSVVGTTDKVTVAKLTAILDYIAAKRDAGELAVLSPYELTLADARPAGGVTVTEVEPGIYEIGEA